MNDVFMLTFNTLLFTLLGGGIAIYFRWISIHLPDIIFTTDIKKEEVNSYTEWFASFFFFLGISLNFFELQIQTYSFPEILVYSFFLTILASNAYADIRYHLVSNILIVMGIIFWICFAFIGFVQIIPSLISAIAAATIFILIRFLGSYFYQSPGMGIGDIKMVFLIGLFMQDDVFWIIYLSTFMGGIWAIIGLLTDKLKRNGQLPLTPFLWVATTLSMFFLPFGKVLSLWI